MQSTDAGTPMHGHKLQQQSRCRAAKAVESGNGNLYEERFGNAADSQLHGEFRNAAAADSQLYGKFRNAAAADSQSHGEFRNDAAAGLLRSHDAVRQLG